MVFINTTILPLETLTNELNVDIFIDKSGYLNLPEINGFKIKKYFKINRELMDKGHFLIDRYFTDGFIKFKGTPQFHADSFSHTLYDYDPIYNFIHENKLNEQDYMEAIEKYDSILIQIGNLLENNYIPNFIKDADIGDTLDIFGRFKFIKLDSILSDNHTEYALTGIQYALDVKKKHYSLYRKYLKQPFSFLYCQSIPHKTNSFYFSNILNHGQGDYQYNYCLNKYKKKINAEESQYLLITPHQKFDIMRDLMLVIADGLLGKHLNTEGEYENWHYFYDVEINNESYHLNLPYEVNSEIKDLDFTFNYKLNGQKKMISIPYELLVLHKKEDILSILLFN